jgi:aspartokinase/homoserine dehydrogenase 1
MSTLPNAHDSRSLGPANSSAETIAKRSGRSNGNSRSLVHAPDGAATASELLLDPAAVRHTIRAQAQRNMPLHVIKFGGTSVGDAHCIARVMEIIRSTSRESDLVVVVSAMSGVTNKLVSAALQSEAGNYPAAASILEELRSQHELAAQTLIHSAIELDRLREKTNSVLQEGADLCRRTSLSRELTLRARDAISSLGERLSAPLLAAALTEHGIPSEAIEATEVLVTDDCFGGAEPLMELTRERCEARVRPLLQNGIVPVITGFIGATVNGELTTLGRGGSDYSATILGAVFSADEVTIWTDVDGVLTSDPRMVPGACTIPEISYREAAELAHFGAKVLHPKTLRPLMQTHTPLWIRNTFAPEKTGTKVTPEGSLNDGGVKALTAFSDAALIRVGGPAMASVANVLARTFTAIAAAQADVLLILHSSSQNDVRFVVPSALAKATVEALRREFAQELAVEIEDHITLDSTIGIITVVGQNMGEVSAIIGRTFNALQRENVDIIAIAQGSSDCNVSFVVGRDGVKAGLMSTHREFQLGLIEPEEFPAK